MTDVYIIVSRYNEVLFSTTDYREAKDKFDTYTMPGYYLYKIPASSAQLLKMR